MFPLAFPSKRSIKYVCTYTCVHTSLYVKICARCLNENSRYACAAAYAAGDIFLSISSNE